MYLQGRRFAEGSSSKYPTFELSAMQARSYLAAINALSLVEKRNAWFSVPGAPAKSLKVNHLPSHSTTCTYLNIDRKETENVILYTRRRVYKGQIPRRYHNVRGYPNGIRCCFVTTENIESHSGHV